MIRRVFILVALCVAAAGLPTARGAILGIQIRHLVNGDPLLLDSLRYKNAAGETFSVSRLSYLLSGFALERIGGGWVELPDQVAWMDAAQRRIEVQLKTIPEGAYRALAFDVGLGPAANNADLAVIPSDSPLNPNVNGLHWSWLGGYIFLAIEGHFRTAASPDIAGYALHLAREPNRARVNLPVTLDLRHDGSLGLDFDAGALLNAPHAISFQRDGNSTHSREGDPLAAGLKSNLAAAFRVREFRSSLPAISIPSGIKPLYLPATYEPYRFTFSKSFPIPDLPRDNPLLVERVSLGEKLFHDPILSRDGSISCASCHQAAFGFSDPRRFSAGVDGRLGTRHAMPLFNLAWKSSFFWDGRTRALRDQPWVPIQDHVEMDETPAHVVAKLSRAEGYPHLFEAAFGSPEITSEKIGLAFENYLLTITSFDSKFDRAMRGAQTLSTVEQRGFQLFMTEYDPRTGQSGADCFHCHGGALFTDQQFHNNGLALSPDDSGRFALTRDPADRGKFATPSLRNLARTGPYMHDGRFATLEQVVAHYNHGVQRTATLDPNLAKHPASGLSLTAADQQAIVAFLNTLNDDGPGPKMPEARQ